VKGSPGSSRYPGNLIACVAIQMKCPDRLTGAIEPV
jgi:hypothetical protein